MVYCEFQPQSSGVARHIDGLCRALFDMGSGITPVVLAQAPHVTPSDAFEVDGGGFASLHSQIQRCDIVHAHGSRTALSAAAIWLARWAGKPVVFTPHCYYQGGSAVLRTLKWGWDRLIEAAIIRNAGAMILLHDGWTETVQELGFSPQRVEVIPNCLDSQALSHRLASVAPQKLSGSPALLSVGRLDPVKRIGDAIAALAVPGLEAAELHIIGQGGDRPRLEALAIEHGVKERVHFLGWQDDDKTAAFMQGCDAMVLASEREGLPTVVLEALLAQVPIVVSDIEGNRAITDAVHWPHVFPLGDVQALASCVQACIKQGGADHTAQAVHRIFSWQSRARDVAALYQDLMMQRKAIG